MKKLLKIISYIVIAAVFAVGGYFIGSHNGMDSISSALPRVNITHNGEDLPNSPPPGDEEPTDPEKTGRTVIKTDESAVSAELKLIDSYSGGLLNDGETANLSVYASEETDGARLWLVEVADNDGGFYALTEKSVSGGSVYFEVTRTDEKTAVNVFTRADAGMEIKQYTYGKNGFTETTLYNSGSADTLYSSVPDYQ